MFHYYRFIILVKNIISLKQNKLIFLCNNDTVNTCTATLELSADGSNFNFLAKGLVVPPATTISIIDRPIFLDETDLIRGLASASGDIDYIISGQKTAD